MATASTGRPLPGVADPGRGPAQAEQLRWTYRTRRPRLPLRQRPRRDARPATRHLDQRRTAHVEEAGQGGARTAAVPARETRRDRRGVRGREQAGRRTPSLGGRRGRRGTATPGEGAADHHGRGRLAPGLGHAAHPARGVRDRRGRATQGSRALPAQPAGRPGHRPTPALGTRTRPGTGPAGPLRLRRHARDLALPSPHRLDRRRRLAVETPLRTPQVQLPRRHHLGTRHRRRQATGGRPERGAHRGALREPARRSHHTRHGSCAAADQGAGRRASSPPAPDLDGMVAHELERFAVK